MKSRTILLSGTLIATCVATSSGYLFPDVDTQTFGAIFAFAIAYIFGAASLMDSDPKISGLPLRVITVCYLLSAVIFGVVAVRMLLA
jgi:hypothetical protein